MKACDGRNWPLYLATIGDLDKLAQVIADGNKEIEINQTENDYDENE